MAIIFSVYLVYVCTHVCTDTHACVFTFMCWSAIWCPPQQPTSIHICRDLLTNVLWGFFYLRLYCTGIRHVSTQDSFNLHFNNSWLFLYIYDLSYIIFLTQFCFDNVTNYTYGEKEWVFPLGQINIFVKLYSLFKAHVLLYFPHAITCNLLIKSIAFTHIFMSVEDSSVVLCCYFH